MESEWFQNAKDTKKNYEVVDAEPSRLHKKRKNIEGQALGLLVSLDFTCYQASI